VPFEYCSHIASFHLKLFVVDLGGVLCFQFFWRRRLLMAKPLLKEYGIASIILENPYCIL